MKHLKIFEEFSIRDLFKKKSSTEEKPSQEPSKPSEENKYTFEPNENILNMMDAWQSLWTKSYIEHEGSIQSLTGDRSNVTYFSFLGTKETDAKQKEILDAAVKSGYKPVKPISNPPSNEDWSGFTKAIAGSLKK